MSDKSQSDPRPSMVAGGAPGAEPWPEAVRGESTVTMMFPHEVSVNLDEYAGLIKFPKGIQQVPESLKNHWYLRQNGVKLYAPPEDAMPEIGEKHLKFLQSQGHSASTLAGVETFVKSLDSEKRKSFFAAADWQAAQEPAAPPVDLNKMTKAQIVDHAAATHGLELDPKLRHDELVAAVEEHVASRA